MLQKEPNPQKKSNISGINTLGPQTADLIEVQGISDYVVK